MVISIVLADTDEHLAPPTIFKCYDSGRNLYYYCIRRDEEVLIRFSTQKQSFELPGFLFLTLKEFLRHPDCKQDHKKSCLFHGTDGDAVFARSEEDNSKVVNNCISNPGQRGDIHVRGEDLSSVPVTFVRISSEPPSKCSCLIRLLIEGVLGGQRVNAEILLCLLL